MNNATFINLSYKKILESVFNQIEFMLFSMIIKAKTQFVIHKHIIQIIFKSQKYKDKKMGQKQTIQNPINSQSYPQQKPSEIFYLQSLIDEGRYSKVDPSSLLSKDFQLLLNSQSSQHYRYGIKIKDNELTKLQAVNIQALTAPVQIYLINENKKNITETKVFEGQLFKGKRHNFGVQFNQKGEQFYKGYFKNNKCHGWGITSNYEGQWANGTKFGYGKYQSKNDKIKFTYEGDWKNDRFDGLGARNISISNSSKFIKQDYAQYNEKIDYQYIGQWNKGTKFGCGKYIKYIEKNGKVQTQVYEGEFAHNLYHGRGKIKVGQENFKQGVFQSGLLIRTS